MQDLSKLLLAVAIMAVVPNMQCEKCGTHPGIFGTRITHGHDAMPGSWPWHCAILRTMNQLPSVYACGCVVISEVSVLTAAHCVVSAGAPLDVKQLKVSVGLYNRSEHPNRSQNGVHFVDSLIPHPDYNNSTLDNDIAFIRVNASLEVNGWVYPVCLWQGETNLNRVVGHTGWVVGFGLDEYGIPSTILQAAEIPIVDHWTCVQSNRRVYAYNLGDRMFCAGARDGVSPCNGDSGGGLYLKYNDYWHLRGIVSFSPLLEGNSSNICDKMQYTVFTDVALYGDWIDLLMADFGHRGLLDGDLESRAINKEKTTTETMSTTTDISEVSSAKPQPANFENCGANLHTNKPHNYMHSGQPRYPWRALVITALKRSYCLATFVSRSHLVTTAQCVSSSYEEAKPLAVFRATIQCKTLATMRCREHWKLLAIDKTIIHEMYAPFSASYNIALIRLKQPLEESDNDFRPICLPLAKELISDPAAMDFEIGRAFLDDSTPFRKTVHTICTKNHSAKKYDICYTSDSGCPNIYQAAPLTTSHTINGTERHVLQGLFSYEDPDCTCTYNIIIANMVDWILGHIVDSCEGDVCNDNHSDVAN